MQCFENGGEYVSPSMRQDGRASEGSQRLLPRGTQRFTGFTEVHWGSQGKSATQKRTALGKVSPMRWRLCSSISTYSTRLPAGGWCHQCSSCLLQSLIARP